MKMERTMFDVRQPRCTYRGILLPETWKGFDFISLKISFIETKFFPNLITIPSSRLSKQSQLLYLSSSSCRPMSNLSNRCRYSWNSVWGNRFSSAFVRADFTLLSLNIPFCTFWKHGTQNVYTKPFHAAPLLRKGGYRKSRPASLRMLVAPYAKITLPLQLRCKFQTRIHWLHVSLSVTWSTAIPVLLPQSWWQQQACHTARTGQWSRES